MSRLPPYAILLAVLSAVIGVVVVESPLAIAGSCAPPVLALLASARGRRTYARRLLVTAPLIGVAVALRWLGHVEARQLLPPALRIVSALAWSSWLSILLAPPQMRGALRALGAPSALLELLAHTRRFAGQLAETCSEAWNAAALRGGLRSPRATAGTVGYVAGVVVVRAFDRAECVAIAGALRGGHFVDDALLEEVPSLAKLEGSR